MSHVRTVRLSTFDRTSQGMMNVLGFILSLVYMQAVHGWLSTYERLVNSQKFFSPYLTQEDLSRLGREYIETGRYLRRVFPAYGVRFIAITDSIDTDEGENELAPIRNLFNEWYARDISKKRRISNKIKGNAGEPMGQPPYLDLVRGIQYNVLL